MRTVELILGPPGTGKTTTLLDMVNSALESGIAPERIAFLAFTRKAAHEAISRACQRFDLPKTRFPYFRTLHSLAFHSMGLRREQVMSTKHYKEVGTALGLEFKGNYNLEEFFPAADGVGDRVHRIEHLARVRGDSLENAYHNSGDIDLRFASVKQYADTIDEYKRANDLFDFNDMLASYNNVLPVDLFILDEAQDLTTLQWDMAKRAAAEATTVKFAGDDDQAIFTWAGADLQRFLSFRVDKTTVLPISYRLPQVIWDKAVHISSRIRLRFPKEWFPRKEQGSIETVADLEYIDFSEGTWMILARNDYLLDRAQNHIKSMGHPYIRNGISSIDNPTVKAIIAWEAMRRGEIVRESEARNVAKYIRQARVKAGGGLISMAEMVTPHTGPWMEAFDTLSLGEMTYYRAMLRRGESLTKPPRISISTIHTVKGGEAENVVVIPDISHKVWLNRYSDDEARVFYVAVTRAKQKLFLLWPRSLKHYDL